MNTYKLLSMNEVTKDLSEKISFCIMPPINTEYIRIIDISLNVNRVSQENVATII